MSAPAGSEGDQAAADGRLATDRSSGSGGPAVTRWRWVGWLATVVVVVVAVVALRDRWDEVEATGAGLPGAGWVAAAVAANVVANGVLADAWRYVVRLASGRSLSLPVAAHVWGSSQLSRLLFPGATVGARAGMGLRHGVPAVVGAATTLFEVAWMVSAVPLLMLATVPWWLPGLPGSLSWVPWLGVLPLLFLGALVVVPQRCLGLVAAVMERVPVLRERVGHLAERVRGVPLDRRASAGLLVRHLVNLALRLAAFLALFAGVAGAGGAVVDGGLLLRATGVFAVARFVGAVAVFAPAGLGPREGVTVLALGPVLGGGPALLLAAAERLVELVAELLMLAVARVAMAGGAGDVTPTP